MKEFSETNKAFDFKKLKLRYVFALITIAVTVILSQFLIQYNINTQLNDSRLINISGKQRMLSQKIVKEILILNAFSDPIKTQKQDSILRQTIFLWKSTQNDLQFGNENLQFPKEHSTKMSLLYKNLRPNFELIVTNCQLILENKKTANDFK